MVHKLLPHQIFILGNLSLGRIIHKAPSSTCVALKLEVIQVKFGLFN